MKKTKILCMLFPLLLTGCSLNTSIDALLTPPKLSAQQEQIYNALTNYTGSNISLKYPRTGENLSAFVVDDIDNDSKDEAIVFYNKNAIKTEDNSLRINILDQENSGWRSVYDHAADGNEIEQVMITKLGENDRVNIIVGYSLINQSEKVLSIYDYSGGKLNTTFENNYYSLFDAADLNGDGKKELFTALNQSVSRRASAAVYYLAENGNYLRSSVDLNESYTNYKKLIYGTLSDGSTAVYLDAETTSGTIATEILAVNKDNTLSSVYSPDIEKNETVRPSAYESRDIDGDGAVEIPVPFICPGYDDSGDDQIYLTKWYGLQDKKPEQKYISYMSITEGYTFIIPEKWYDHVTVINNPADNEIKLNSYDESPDDSTEILSIKTTSENEEAEALWNSGYDLLHSRGDKKFFIKVNKENEFVDSPAEIMLKFRFED